jgi:LasA protease
MFVEVEPRWYNMRRYYELETITTSSMRANGMKSRIALTILFLWLLPALACNLPVAPDFPTAPTIDIEQAVQQTLAARLLETARVEQIPLLEETVEPNEEVPPLPEIEAPTPAPPAPVPAGDTFQYTIRSGDTPAALALRFNVDLERFLDPMVFPPQMMLPVGQVIAIPNEIGSLRYTDVLLPDGEIVYSPAVLDFSTVDFINQAGGFLSTYTEEVDGEMLTGAEIIERVAQDTSTNPRLLLAFLEYRSNWVFGQPANQNRLSYPIGFNVSQYTGLLKELTLVSRQLTIGYYGWRSGSVTEIEFPNRTRQRISPDLNAGTAAIQYLFSKLYNSTAWEHELYSPGNFLTFYTQNFGDPWQRAAVTGPVIPDGLQQPALELPFPAGETWTMTGGPHAAWGIGSPWGGLDFAPSGVERGCAVSRFWATASAPGVVVRSERGMVVLDLDGDGNVETGWVLLYLHIATQDRPPVGTRLNQDDRVGHPSCEGGVSTGTHIHIARKYNGEWIAAEGPVPFVLSGWQAWKGQRAYSGTLTKDGEIITARPDGVRTSLITR